MYGKRSGKYTQYNRTCLLKCIMACFELAHVVIILYYIVKYIIKHKWYAQLEY